MKHPKSRLIYYLLILFSIIWLNNSRSEDRTSDFDGMEGWRFNLLYGNPLIVKGILNRDNSSPVELDLFHDGSPPVHALKIHIKVDEIVFAEPPMILDARFMSGLFDEKIEAFDIPVFFLGPEERLARIADGLLVLNPDPAFGRYILNALDQPTDLEDMHRLLESRRKVFERLWRRYEDVKSRDASDNSMRQELAP